jgi:hypothetical protein
LPHGKKVLVLDLKSPLPSHVLDLINNLKRKYFPRAQMDSSKDGKENWVIAKPAGGYYRLLGTIQGILLGAPKIVTQKANVTNITWYLSWFLDLILAFGVLMLDYFALAA